MKGLIIIDAGPLAYSSIEVAGDRDFEAALRRDDLEPAETSYRLIEIPLSTVDVYPWLERWHEDGFAHEAVEALSRGERLPPIVGRVAGDTFVVLDGGHRLTAWFAAGHDRVRALELLAA